MQAQDAETTRGPACLRICSEGVENTSSHLQHISYTVLDGTSNKNLESTPSGSKVKTSENAHRAIVAIPPLTKWASTRFFGQVHLQCLPSSDFQPSTTRSTKPKVELGICGSVAHESTPAPLSLYGSGLFKGMHTRVRSTMP